MDPISELTALYYKKMRLQYPNFPEAYFVKPKYKDTTANGLARCITEFLNMSGQQGERISNTGRYLDKSKTVKDTLGMSRTIGSGKYIPGTGTNGTADISATINGRSVKIEIKIGKDVQSEQQIEYQKKIEAAGGVYHIASDFESFYNWYKQLTLTL